MKKNVAICIMGALLLLMTYLCFCYITESIELADTCSELKKESLADTSEEEKRQGEYRKSIPYNYLCDEDVRACPIHPYDSDVQGLPKGGITRVMAARIAEAVWFSQFGDRIVECRPYSVVFSKGLWIVAAYHSEEIVGNPYMEIDSKDGRIVRYILGK